MSNQPPGSAPSPPRRASSRRRLVVFVGLGLLVALVLAGSWAYLKYRAHTAHTAGLAGVWHDPTDPKHAYRFRAGGDVDAWYEGLPMGRFLTWQRDGQRITVRTTRHWDFVGQLDGSEIRGQEILRDPTGATVNAVDAVWRRE